MTGDIATSRTTDRRNQISINPLDLLLLQDDLSTLWKTYTDVANILPTAPFV